MVENAPDLIEWHICENPHSAESSTPPRQPIQMGPFLSEQECRTVLDRLKQIPCFCHGALEVRKKYRRREQRVLMNLQVQVSRLSQSSQV
jgi:hypothetical protein